VLSIRDGLIEATEGGTRTPPVPAPPG